MPKPQRPCRYQLDALRSSLLEPMVQTGALLVAFLCLPVVVVHGDIVVDDDFSGGENYQVFAAEITGNPDSTSFASFSVFASGGNPGHYLEATNHHDVTRNSSGLPPGGNGFTSVVGIFTNVSSTYLPTSDGALVQFEAAIDVRIRSGSSARELSFFLESDRAGEFIGFDDQVMADGTWQSVSLTISPTVAGKIGEDVFFGFSFTSDADVTFGSEERTIDFDNFRVSAIAVPEPAMFPVLGSILAGQLYVRRRRNT